MIADGLRRGACTRSARMRALAVHARARARVPVCCHAAVVHVQPRQTSSAHVLCASPSVCRNRRGALTDVKADSGRLPEFHIHRSQGVLCAGSLLCTQHGAAFCACCTMLVSCSWSGSLKFVQKMHPSTCKSQNFLACRRSSQGPQNGISRNVIITKLGNH
jgi:hypothetical protein